MLTKEELWNRLSNYQFEDLVPPNLWDTIRAKFGGINPSAKAFAAKVAKRNNWTLEFALRGLEEYKRYVFLGVTADFPVTPSKVIDAFWHEHGLFMAGYRHFRKEVIEHDFLHYPELVSADEDNETYRSQYMKTLALYYHEFDHLPPSDIWARPKFAPRRGGIRASKARSAHYPQIHLDYDLEDLVETLGEIIENFDPSDLPLKKIFSREVPDQTVPGAVFIPDTSTKPDQEAQPESDSPAEVPAEEYGNVCTDPTSDTGTTDVSVDSGPSCSSSSCGSSCGGGGD